MRNQINCHCRCHPDISRCIRLIEEGINAQCVGLENFRRHEFRAGREHTLWGLRKVEEGLHCIERQRR